jgi:adenine-specific DNA-methyltransferase
MGAYFSVRTARKSRPLPLIDAVSPPDPRATLTSGKLMAKALAASYEGGAREATARAFTSAVVDAYWNSIQESGPLRFPLPGRFVRLPEADLSPTAQSMARGMGRAASGIEPLAAAYLISGTYTAMMPDERRSRLGAYYTPPPLAERLVAMATEAGVNWRTCRILDPACGGGAFLSAVAKPLLKAASRLSPSQILDEIEKRLKGFEIDPYAAWLSQVFLEATLMPVCQRAERRAPVVAVVCDSLLAKEPTTQSGPYDLVIGNPPYGRISLSEELRDRYRRSLYGHANLYGVFTDLATRFSRNGGIIAYVTPTSFLAGEYFKALRSLLSSSARPVNIDFVSVRKGVFEDALQETMLATYRKSGIQGSQPTVHFIAPTDDDGITVEKGGTFEISGDGGPWLVPRTPDQARLVASLREMPHRLRDYGYEVSTGPLVWNRHKSQLVTKAAKTTYPLIWAEAITPAGRFQFRADKKNHLPYFRIESGDDWLVTKTPCVLLQRTTAKEQSRRLIAAELPASFIEEHGAVVIENHINMIRPINGSPAVSASVLAAMLNSSALDRAFRCISGSVAVSAYELESLPLPPPADLKRLVGRSVTPEAIERACSRLYVMDGEV